MNPQKISAVPENGDVRGNIILNPLFRKDLGLAMKIRLTVAPELSAALCHKPIAAKGRERRHDEQQGKENAFEIGHRC